VCGALWRLRSCRFLWSCFLCLSAATNTDVSERSKIKDHKAQAEEYEMYQRAFELNSAALLLLDAADILFFGL